VTYLDRTLFQQESLNAAVERLEHYFQLASEAEDSHLVTETIIFNQQCQRWCLIASLIAVGVKATEYADN
jgi:hypothetical protein